MRPRPGKKPIPTSLLGVACVVLATGAAVLVATPASASEVGGPITRAEMIQRAQYWVDQRVIYGWDKGPPEIREYTADSAGKKYAQDCSGYVSMAWHMRGSLNTNGFFDSDQVDPVPDPDDMRPGDAVLRTGHIELFAQWKDSTDHSRGAFSYSLNGPYHGDWAKGPSANFKGEVGTLSWSEIKNQKRLKYDKVVEGTLPDVDYPDLGLPGGRSYGADGQHHIYGRGTGGLLQHYWYNDENPGWHQAALPDTQGGQPASYHSDGIHHVYARGGDGALWHWWYNMGNPGWESARLGDSITEMPTAYYTEGVHHVYVRAANGQLRHWWYNNANPGWQSATLAGDTVTDSPSGYFADGIHHVYARSAATGELLHWWYNNARPGWHADRLGGKILGSPTAYAAGYIHHVYARGTNSGLYHWWYNTAQPSAWQLAAVAGPTISDNAVAYYSEDGTHHVYGRGSTNGHLVHWWYNDANPGWHADDLGGDITGAPTAYEMEGIHHIYARSGGDLRHFWYNMNNPGWQNATVGTGLG